LLANNSLFFSQNYTDVRAVWQHLTGDRSDGWIQPTMLSEVLCCCVNGSVNHWE
jgi:hypothetical protein